MLIQDKIKRKIDITNISSVKRGFNLIYSEFKRNKTSTKHQLLNVAKWLHDQIEPKNYEWKSVLKRIKELISFMQKDLK